MLRALSRRAVSVGMTATLRLAGSSGVKGTRPLMRPTFLTAVRLVSSSSSRSSVSASLYSRRESPLTLSQRRKTPDQQKAGRPRARGSAWLDRLIFWVASAVVVGYILYNEEPKQDICWPCEYKWLTRTQRAYIRSHLPTYCPSWVDRLLVSPFERRTLREQRLETAKKRRLQYMGAWFGAVIGSLLSSGHMAFTGASGGEQLVGKLAAGVLIGSVANEWQWWHEEVDRLEMEHMQDGGHIYRKPGERRDPNLCGHCRCRIN